MSDNMSDNTSDGPALPNANGIAQAHTNGDQEAQRAPGAMLLEVGFRRNNNLYAPGPQNLGNFLATCHTLNQATVVFLVASSQQQDTPSPSLQERAHVRKVAKVVKSPNFMEKQMEVWQLLLKDENSIFRQTSFPSAEQVHDKFFVIETVDGEVTLCPFDRLGVSATVLGLVRQVLGDQTLSKAASIRGNLLYSSAGRSTDLGFLAEPQYHDDAFEDGRYRGLSLFCNINNGRPLSLVAIEYRPKHFSLDAGMIAALENGIVPTRGISGDDSSPAGVITAMITQVLDCMVKSGVRYGYLYSVEGIVFLEIQKDPSVVHYFVSLPKDEVDNYDESTMPYSAISQIFAFIVRAMRTTSSFVQPFYHTDERNSQTDERLACNNKADERAAWNNKADEHAAWNNQADEDERAARNNIKVVVRENNVDEVAMQLQQWGKPNASSAQCEQGQEMMDTDVDSSGNEFDGEPYDKCSVDIGEESAMEIEIRMDSDVMEEALSAAAAAAAAPVDQMQGLTLQDEQLVQIDGVADKENQSEGRQEIAQASDDHDDEMQDDEMQEDEDVDGNVDVGVDNCMNHFQKMIRGGFKYTPVVQREDSYCTQQCLLGVANGLPVDKACPNFHLHGDQHIGKEEFLERLKDQLSRAGRANASCSPIDLWGTIGTMFKVTLVGYGYTFVAKATLRADWVILHREGEMYDMLKDIQGSCIPVYLGIVRVAPEFRHAERSLTQFMVLSWAGLPLRRNFAKGDESLLTDSVYRAYSELHGSGMQHRDPDLSNMLYSSLTGRIMLIDFHGSRFHPARLAVIEAARQEAKKNDAAQESDSEDEGIPYEADGSVSTAPRNKAPPTIEELEAMRRKFEDECREEVTHAVKAMEWFVASLHDRRN